MKKSLLFGLVFMMLCGYFPSLAQAAPAIYYVSKDGNDSWDGTTAAHVSGSAGPFLTIQKCASVAQAGDTCIVRAGTYRETVKPANSGTATAAITFQPYANESVTISGADDITAGWTPTGGRPGVYQKTVALNPSLFANQVFVDGHMMTQARWPNTSDILLYPTLATAQDHSGVTASVTETVYDANLPNLDLTGAKVWMLGGAQFTSHSGTISSSAPGQFTFNQPMNGCGSLCTKPGSRYFLYGSMAFLDAPSEWQYDSASQTLYLKTPDGANPSTHASVEAKQRSYALDLSGRSYIQIKGLRVFAATILTDSASQYNVFDGIDVQYPSHYIDIPDDPVSGPYGAHNGDTGVILDGSYNTLKNSTIAYSAGNGIMQAGRFNTITNNLIHDTDYAGTYNAPIRFTGAESDVTVTYNTIYNTGRDGMTGGSQRNRIAYNNVYDFGLIDKDLGGYYTCCGTTLGTGTSIDHNWFHDDKSGTGVGIYIDNGASQFLIHHNVSWNNNNVGIMLNGYTTGKSLGNLVYNNTIGSGQVKSIGSGGATSSTGTELKNNIFRGPTEPIPGGSVWASNLSSSTDPLFVDAAAGNHHLQSGSPSIDVGAVISGITDGYKGSAPDQGAYENGQQDWIPGCNFNGYGRACSFTNMVANPGFEQGTSGWKATAGEIATAPDAHSGTSSLKVYNRTGASNSARQSIAIENGKTYNFSAWTKLGSGSDAVYLMLEIVVDGKTYWRQLAANFANATAWTPLARTFTFNETGPITSAKLYVQTGTSLADLYVDDMYAEPFKTRLSPPGMYVDRTKLNDAIAAAQEDYSLAVEGSEHGQYPVGSKTELLAAIQAAQTVAGDSEASEDMVDGAARSLKAAVAAFKSTRNLDPAVVIDIDPMLADRTGWDAEPGRLDFTGGSLTFKATSTRSVAGYTGSKIPHNAILQFRTKLDTSNGFEGFGLRAQNTSKPAWSSNTQYLIVVKTATIEVQKWNGGSLIVESIPNTVLPSGSWHTVQLGAVDTKGGVQIIMNVDGANVVDWTDTNNPIQDEGYFEIYGSGSGLPIMLGSIDTTPPASTEQAPNAPTGLTAKAGNGEVALTWSPVQATESVTYSVYMGTASGSYGSTPVATVTSTTYGYTATGLTNGTTYYFAVKASHAGGSSGYSNEVSATPKLNLSVTYNDNGATSGGAPVDSGTYTPGDIVSVYDNAGNLAKTGYTFEGWNTAADGSGTSYAPGASFTMGEANVTLYANWKLKSTDESPGSYSSPTSQTDTVISTNGKIILPVGKKGELSLGDAVKIVIPSDAFGKELQITVDLVTDAQSLIAGKDTLVSPVFEILKNFSENFSKEITLTFTFDPTKLKNGQKPSVFYYDELKQSWVEVGGLANGNTITVQVNHLTKYAVFGVGQGTDDANQSNPFNDIAGHWAEANIKQAVSAGIIKGYPDGTFKPDRTVTRAEFAVMLMNVLKPQGDGAAPTSFTDQEKIGAWAQHAVAQAGQAGIIKGYDDGSFRPDAAITRLEMAATVARALGQSSESVAATGFADDKDIPEWARGAAAVMKKLGMIEGKGANQFAPGDKTTRAEAVTVLLRVLAYKDK